LNVGKEQKNGPVARPHLRSPDGPLAGTDRAVAARDASFGPVPRSPYRGCRAPHLARPRRFCWIAAPDLSAEARVVPFFVQIKCHLGKSYEVANKLADSEIASEIYSTAGDFDLLVKFYVEDGIDIGHFVTEKVQTIPGIQDTRTIITFKAF
jgi:DNA-binding Lrp family transcriptional regulator